VLLVEYRGGELVYDPYREDVPLPVADRPLAIVQPEPPAEREAFASLAEGLSWVEQRWRRGAVLVNADHVVSYAGLRSWARGSTARRGLIVVDQHLDAYSYEHTRSILNKANFLRRALDEGLVEAIACVGARAAEQALFDGDASLVPEEHSAYVEREHHHGVFAGLKSKIKLYPAPHYSLAQGLGAALRELAGRGLGELGIDLDLDAFDSRTIVGVDYNLDWPARAARFVAGRIVEKHFPPPLDDWLGVLQNITFTRYEISSPGLDPARAAEAVVQTLEQAAGRGLSVPFRALSEFEPAFDDGHTAKLAGGLIAALRSPVAR
jgi:arginase family enzyme